MVLGALLAGRHGVHHRVARLAVALDWLAQLQLLALLDLALVALGADQHAVAHDLVGAVARLLGGLAVLLLVRRLGNMAVAVSLDLAHLGCFGCVGCWLF